MCYLSIFNQIICNDYKNISNKKNVRLFDIYSLQVQNVSFGINKEMCRYLNIYFSSIKFRSLGEI